MFKVQVQKLRLHPRAVDAFPRIFCNSTLGCKERTENRKKALRWWQGRHDFITKLNSPEDGRLYVTSRHAIGIVRKRFQIKAMSRRGRPRKEWVQYVYDYLNEEFERLIELEVKVTSNMLPEIAQYSLEQNKSPVNGNHIEPTFGKQYSTLITKRLITNFQEYSNIVRVRMSSNKNESIEHQAWTNKNIAYHLGDVSRRFQAGQLNKDWFDNLDETNFTYDTDNGYVLAKRGTCTTYKEVVSGSEGFTVVIPISGGVN